MVRGGCIAAGDPLGLRIGRFQLAVNETGRTLKRRGPIALPPVAVLVPNLHLLIRAIDECMALLLGQFTHWGLRVKAHCLTQTLHQLDKVAELGEECHG